MTSLQVTFDTELWSELNCQVSKAAIGNLNTTEHSCPMSMYKLLKLMITRQLVIVRNIQSDDWLLVDDMKYKFIVKVFNLYTEKRVNND